jgi:hypothetical protein
MMDGTGGVGGIGSDDRDGRVQEAYDYFEGRSAFIIADTATDGAWIAVPEGQETSVEARR